MCFQQLSRSVRIDERVDMRWSKRSVEISVNQTNVWQRTFVTSLRGGRGRLSMEQIQVLDAQLGRLEGTMFVQLIVSNGKKGRVTKARDGQEQSA